MHGAGGGWPYTGVFNCTGWPVVVVRCGSSADGKLPIGVQVVAAPWREDLCIAVASYLESRSGGWKRPPAWKPLPLSLRMRPVSSL